MVWKNIGGITIRQNYKMNIIGYRCRENQELNIQLTPDYVFNEDELITAVTSSNALTTLKI